FRVRLDRGHRHLQQPRLLRRPRDQRGQPTTQSSSLFHSRLLRPNTLRLVLSSGGGPSRGSITSGRSETAGTAGAPGSSVSTSRASTSRARDRYASAPREPESYTVMGFPYPGASERRTVRGMTVSYTRLPK